MKIRFKLLINLGMFIILSIIFILLLMWSRALMIRSVTVTNYFMQIELSSYQLSQLTYDMIIHPAEKRAEQQWNNKFKSFNKLLDSNTKVPESIRDGMASLKIKMQELNQLHQRLITTKTQLQQTPDKQLILNKRQSRIAAGISSLTHEMASKTSQMRASVSAEHYVAINRLFFLMLLVTLLATVILILISFILVRSMLHGVKELHNAILNVTQGNLDYRISLETKDELEDYSRAFNNMVTRLDKTMASKDALNNEIKEHLMAERQLRDYRDSLEIKVKERTEALDKSRMAAISIMEDSNYQRHEAEHARDAAETANRALAKEITIREQTEQKLRANEKNLKTAIIAADSANMAKSTFLANMSHELRTPLNAILGFSEMMSRDNLLSDGNKERLNVINRSGEHLLNMINDVLDISKIEAGRMELEPEFCDLTLLLSDIEQMIAGKAENKGLIFTLEIDPELQPYVILDTGKLRQILINLLGNSLKFTDQGGVSLRARTDIITGDKQQIMLYIELEDNGIGIAEEKLKTIFTPFVQAGSSSRPDKGTGLGLAITKSLLELMGGQISVASTINKGSIFSFHLPAQISEKAQIVVEEKTKLITGIEANQPDWRILIVDDSKENRMLLQQLLTQVGFQVREAEDGKQAIDTFNQWHPDFIWMDMRMPVIDGYEASRIIRKIEGGNKVKIIAITASAFKEQLIEVLEAGCDAVIRKPYKPKEIYDCMAKHLGVRYLYAEDNSPEIENTKTGQQLINSEILGSIPENLITELREAVIVLDVELCLSIISKIRRENAQIAAALMQLVNSLDFRTLKQLLSGE